MKRRSASVIVLTKNSQRHIRKCIESIQIQEYPDFEILVVDAGSKDQTVPILSNCMSFSFRSFNIIEVSSDTTIGKARQIGLEKSKGEILVYIDSDVELTSNRWIGNMMIPLEEQDVCGVQTLSKNEPSFMLKILQKICREPSYEYKYTVIDKEHHEPVGTSHLLLRKSAVIEAGGFKDLNWGEDTDLTDRMMELGYKFVYLPNQKVYHHHVDGCFDYLYRKKLKGHVKSKIRGIVRRLQK
jgi:glycosyltransferase involved in cell wall biosynthesis